MSSRDPNLQDALQEIISAARAKPVRWIVALPVICLVGSVWLISRLFVWKRRRT